MSRSVFYGLFLPLLLFFSFHCSAHEITEQELTTLEGNMTKLEQLTKESDRELNNLKIQLNKSEDELTNLHNRLIELQSINRTQSESLTKANQYLNEYAKEQKQKQRKLKTERNIAILVAIISLVAAIK